MSNISSYCLLTSFCVLLCVSPCAGLSEDWRIWGGTIGRVQPRTKASNGYGNHGKYGTDSTVNLNNADRKNANWDGAPGFALGVERISVKEWLPGLLLGVGPYSRLVVVDTEYNETQENWTFITGAGGIRVTGALKRLPWLKLYGGIGAGGGYVAERGMLLAESDYGVEVGPLRFSEGVQRLSGGRVLDHSSVFSVCFDIGAPDGAVRLSPWYYGFIAGLAEHPGRRVKTIHQNGFAIGYKVYNVKMGAVFLEGEFSWAAVESKIERPLNASVPHNYRTMDEFFYGLYIGADKKLDAVVDHVRASVGVDGYCENDARVNPGGETGCFGGIKIKAGVGVDLNKKVSLMFNFIGGVDGFGRSYGAELSLLSGI